jgi:hypothetical protein
MEVNVTDPELQRSIQEAFDEAEANGELEYDDLDVDYDDYE